MSGNLHRQGSLKAHREHFDDIMKEGLKELSSAFSEASSTVKDIQGGRDLALEMLLTNFSRDLQKKVDRDVHNCLDATWQKFDANGDGVLSQAEMRKLVHTVIKEIRKNLADIMKNAMEPALNDLQSWIESDLTGPYKQSGAADGGKHFVLQAQSQKRVKDASEKLLSLLTRVLDAMLKSADAIADEVFDEVDLDKDKRVTQAEFSSGFVQAFSQALDFTRMVKSCMPARSSSSLRSQSSMLEAPSCDGLIAVGFVVALSAMALKLARSRHFSSR